MPNIVAQVGGGRRIWATASVRLANQTVVKMSKISLLSVLSFDTFDIGRLAVPRFTSLSGRLDASQ
jgi:hypothetical protein